jgi:hypothetical protein
MAAEIIVAPVATTETVETHFLGWDNPRNAVGGFLTFTWDHRAKAMQAIENGLNGGDFEPILSDVVYDLEQDETIRYYHGLEEAALEWLKDNAEEIVDAIKASFDY